MLFRLIEKLYLRFPQNLVYYDSLTGTHTRCYYDRVMKKKYLNKSVIICFIDIDNLKKINDTNGHSYGSKILAKIGMNLRHLTGLLDCCRYGGDEFICVLDPLLWKKDELSHNEFSFGWYEKENYEDLSSAIEKADKNMYIVKSAHHKSATTIGENK